MQGHYLAAEQRRYESATWVSYLITAQTGQEITPEQLLGTEDEAKATKEADAEAKIAALQERARQAAAGTYEVVGNFHG